MPNRYGPTVFSATTQLINAIFDGNYDCAQNAIDEGADINCRVIKEISGGYRIASDAELRQTMRQSVPTTCYGQFNSIVEVDYEVPMVGTTTLLNILARKETQKKQGTLELAELLMQRGAELGAIDYASYWETWGNYAGNYFQNTPLLNAIAMENQGFAHVYLRFLNKLDENPRQEILNYKDKFEAGFHTALEFAIRRGFSKLATDIVRAGADTNPQPFIFAYAGQSPLHMACMSLGVGWIKKISDWHLELGSGLDLILTLLEHGADWNLAASTEVLKVLDETVRPPMRIWETIALTPFDHIDISVQGLQSERLFNVVKACQAPAFRPGIVGQIKHPFHEEYSFRCQLVQQFYPLNTRAVYLKSDCFQKRDKIILQKAILKRILKDFMLTSLEDDVLNDWDIDAREVGDTIDRMERFFESMSKGRWFTNQLCNSGIYYIGLAMSPKFRPKLSIEENPIATLAVRNKIACCKINDSDSVLQYAANLQQNTLTVGDVIDVPTFVPVPNDTNTEHANVEVIIQTTPLLGQDPIDTQEYCKYDANSGGAEFFSSISEVTTPISSDVSEEIDPPVTASFFLQILAHPSVKVIAAILILAGVAGLLFGGIGLVGIGVGLNLMTAVSAGVAGTGTGLGVAGFFASSRSTACALDSSIPQTSCGT